MFQIQCCHRMVIISQHCPEVVFFFTLHYDTNVIHMIIATNRLEPSRIMETQMPPAAEELQVSELASSWEVWFSPPPH